MAGGVLIMGCMGGKGVQHLNRWSGSCSSCEHLVRTPLLLHLFHPFVLGWGSPLSLASPHQYPEHPHLEVWVHLLCSSWKIAQVCTSGFQMTSWRCTSPHLSLSFCNSTRNSTAIAGEIYTVPNSNAKVSVERFLYIINKLKCTKSDVILGIDQNFDFLKYN